MTNFDRKIQHAGWSGNSYKYVRNKVNRFLDADQKELIDRWPKSKKFKCKKNKGNHTFIKLKERKNYFYTHECSACGKLKC